MAPPVDPERFSDLTNALQAALLLAQRLSPALHQLQDLSDDVRAAVERAADAANRLRPSHCGGR